MEAKMTVLAICSVLAAAVAVITGFLESRKARFWLSAVLPALLLVNTVYPPIYAELTYYVVIAAYMAIQALTAYINARWMRITSGIALACVELVLGFMLYRFCSVYYLGHLHLAALAVL